MTEGDKDDAADGQNDGNDNCNNDSQGKDKNDNGSDDDVPTRVVRCILPFHPCLVREAWKALDAINRQWSHVLVGCILNPSYHIRLMLIFVFILFRKII